MAPQRRRTIPYAMRNSAKQYGQDFTSGQSSYPASGSQPFVSGTSPYPPRNTSSRAAAMGDSRQGRKPVGRYSTIESQDIIKRRPAGTYDGTPNNQDLFVEPQLPEFGLSLSDYLAQLEASGMLEQGLNDIAARQADLQRRASEGDARIAAIYASLTDSVNGLNPTISQRYADAQTQTNQNAQSAVSALNQGYNDNQQNVSEVLANLGIQAAAAPIAATGNPEVYRTAAAGDIAQRGQTASNLLASEGVTQGNFNTDTARSSMFRGAEERAGLQSDLLSLLAALEDQKASTALSNQDRLWDRASSLYNADYGRFNDQRAYSDSRDDTSWNRAMQQSEFDMDRQRASQGTPYEDKSAYGQGKQRLIIYGMPAQAADAAISVMTQHVGDINPGAYIRNVQTELQRLGFEGQQLNLALQEALEFYKSYKG